jgi:hypothetical protein
MHLPKKRNKKGAVRLLCAFIVNCVISARTAGNEQRPTLDYVAAKVIIVRGAAEVAKQDERSPCVNRAATEHSMPALVLSTDWMKR